MTGVNRVVFQRVRRSLPGLSAAAFLVLATSPYGMAATLVVSNISPSGAGSLQQAILDANATNGLDTIVFQITGTGVQTISPINALPSITDSVVIDGTTQPGFAGTPLIEINGLNAGLSSDGFRVTAGNSTIRGLIINRYTGAGIHIEGPGGTNAIERNYIGTDATGTLNRGNGQASTQSGGIWVDGSSGNRIGGTDVTNRNLISANGGAGIYIQNCSGNTIQGNIIGTSLSGAAALGNSNNGISVYSAGRNQIGGALEGARNLISGNGGSGVYLNGAVSAGNVVQGNYIGTDVTGALAVPNAGDGITVANSASNSIGGTNSGAGNLLSGNSKGGVTLTGAGADANLVQGNLIGVGASGRLALGNNFSGVTILGCNSNLIGGTTVASRNVISGNKLAGVYLTTNAVGTLVQGNFIGVDVTGTNALGNAATGLSVESASANVIGGTIAGARNIISGNTSYGIDVYGSGSTSNVVQGNYIGLSVTGQSALGNASAGIHITAAGNSVGDSVSGAGNVISGNGQEGIWLDGAANTTVQGNYIGTTAAGTAALKNSRGGIGISGAAANLIGGTAAGAGNLISGNGDDGKNGGMYLIGSGATGNVIQGNRIGTDVTGTLALANRYEGIYLQGAPTNTIGGALAGAGNLISGNQTRGIFLTNTFGNIIQGNLIGTKLDGVSGLGNTFHSIECELGACNTVIGGAGLAGNRIGFAKTIYAGVRIRNGSTNNAVLGNAIFSNGALGIDLGTAGVNANDSCGTGTGANMAENFPVLTQAVSGNGTGIRGTLNSRASQIFLLQFFANPICDNGGYGEGEIYLGQQTVVTSNNCNAGFVVSLPAQVPVGYVITATATDAANNTSEFSACVPVGPMPALTVSAAAGNQIQLAWTNTATGFVLKQTDNLAPPVLWATVTNIPVVISNQFTVLLSRTAARRFYLLSFE